MRSTHAGHIEKDRYYEHDYIKNIENPSQKCIFMAK